MSGDVADEVRQEHYALLYALSVLTRDMFVQVPVYRGLAGRPPAAWHAMLMRACEILADFIPDYGADDFPPGMFNRDVPPSVLTRAAAAEQIRSQIDALVAHHGDLLDVADEISDDAVAYLDDKLRALLDDEHGVHP